MFGYLKRLHSHNNICQVICQEKKKKLILKNNYAILIIGEFMKYIFTIPIAVLAFLYSGASFMYCWNTLVASVFGLTTLTWFQSTAIYGIMISFIKSPSETYLLSKKQQHETDKEYQKRNIIVLLSPAFLSLLAYIAKLLGMV
jgi:hypothetical protein